MSALVGATEGTSMTDVPEQVYRDSARAGLLVWGYGETLSAGELEDAVGREASNPGWRAAVESAYRASQGRGGDHEYLSTACLHGLHHECGAKQRERGEPGKPHCKFCPAVCSCTDPACPHGGNT